MSSIFLWNMSPARTAPNGSHLYLYLPNWLVNVVKYDDCSSSLRLWYPELKSTRGKYCTLVSFRNISLSLGPLWTGCVSALLSCVGSKHNLTFPLGFGTNKKLLHHPAVSSTQSTVMKSCVFSCSSSSWNGFCNAYATCLGRLGMAYCLALSMMRMLYQSTHYLWIHH